MQYATNKLLVLNLLDYKNEMNQSKDKLLSQKHTGFEDLSTFLNISSLLLSADFFFINIHLTPVAETNELSSLKYFLNSRPVCHRPFLCHNPNIK